MKIKEVLDLSGRYMDMSGIEVRKNVEVKKMDPVYSEDIASGQEGPVFEENWSTGTVCHSVAACVYYIQKEGYKIEFEVYDRKGYPAIGIFAIKDGARCGLCIKSADQMVSISDDYMKLGFNAVMRHIEQKREIIDGRE